MNPIYESGIKPFVFQTLILSFGETTEVGSGKNIWKKLLPDISNAKNDLYDLKFMPIRNAGPQAKRS